MLGRTNSGAAHMSNVDSSCEILLAATGMEPARASRKHTAREQVPTRDVKNAQDDTMLRTAYTRSSTRLVAEGNPHQHAAKIKSNIICLVHTSEQRRIVSSGLEEYISPVELE